MDSTTDALIQQTLKDCTQGQVLGGRRYTAAAFALQCLDFNQERIANIHVMMFLRHHVRDATAVLLLKCQHSIQHSRMIR